MKIADKNSELESVGYLIVNNDNVLQKYVKSDKLDFSISSLKYINEYLEKVRKVRKKLSNTDVNKIILRCGVYVGEVIRKSIRKEFIWISFDVACKLSEDIKQFGKSMITEHVLYNTKSQQFLFPLSKVSKFLENGKEDDLFFYAKVILDSKDAV